MRFELKDLLEAVGPTASLVFAAWIFLSFLQSRYVAAFERYRELVNDYRKDGEDARKQSIARQIKIYKGRCLRMQRATQIGVVSAMLLIATLVVAALNVVFPNDALPPIAALLAIVGLLMVIVAAGLVLQENAEVSRLLRDELTDIEGLH